MAAKKDIKFEEALDRLEECVKRLESPELGLDESIKTFEEAVRLVKICDDKLEKAEAKVRILTESEDGTVTDAPFGVKRDED
ncbi:MAG: exodeoxyribonuclease VII small subunit [Clostridia bacterium]|nr:exodeoxyribonuclease VII small subunit [Clostridia bacterium]